ncbi:MAG: hypothetical protein DRG30_09105 [Epsilonproteobacteria bacterium]|nr:MAG: hypothetical protein DRG30_09105 [Campylobacterota bacterium]
MKKFAIEDLTIDVKEKSKRRKRRRSRSRSKKRKKRNSKGKYITISLLFIAIILLTGAYTIRATEGSYDNISSSIYTKSTDDIKIIINVIKNLSEDSQNRVKNIIEKVSTIAGAKTIKTDLPVTEKADLSIIETKNKELAQIKTEAFEKIVIKASEPKKIETKDISLLPPPSKIKASKVGENNKSTSASKKVTLPSNNLQNPSRKVKVPTKQTKSIPKKKVNLTIDKSSRYYVQVGVFNKKLASSYLSKIKKSGFDYIIVKSGKTRKVRIGPYSSFDDANSSIDKINNAIGIKGFIIKSKINTPKKTTNIEKKIEPKPKTRKKKRENSVKKVDKSLANDRKETPAVKINANNTPPKKKIKSQNDTILDAF